jgi:hypothetical protein
MQSAPGESPGPVLGQLALCEPACERHCASPDGVGAWVMQEASLFLEDRHWCVQGVTGIRKYMGATKPKEQNSKGTSGLLYAVHATFCGF